MAAVGHRAWRDSQAGHQARIWQQLQHRAGLQASQHARAHRQAQGWAIWCREDGSHVSLLNVDVACEALRGTAAKVDVHIALVPAKGSVSHGCFSQRIQALVSQGKLPTSGATPCFHLLQSLTCTAAWTAQAPATPCFASLHQAYQSDTSAQPGAMMEVAVGPTYSNWRGRHPQLQVAMMGALHKEPGRTLSMRPACGPGASAEWLLGRLRRPARCCHAGNGQLHLQTCAGEEL